MTLKPIKSEADTTAALQEIERLWDAEPGAPESDTLEILVTLVEVYEKGRYDLPPPDPAAALEYFDESRGCTREQSGDPLNKHIGSDFDDFLREEGILEEVTARARKRLLLL